MSFQEQSFPTPKSSRKLLVSLITLLLVVGCSQGARRVNAPGMNPSRAGKAAIEQYDTDGDGLIGGTELDKAAGVKAAMGNIDTDNDGMASADEIAARVKSWQESGIGLTNISATVLLNGKPLQGASVVFEPESFLGDNILPGYAESSRLGLISPSIPKDKRPSPDSPPGLAFGLYKVRITRLSSGGEQIPPQYNTETLLGQEVSEDDPAMVRGRVIFNLETK